MPGLQLPLNIFEPRYLAMARDVMKGNRLIGMIQPREQTEKGSAPALFTTGCVGKVFSFKETPDGRIEMMLEGISRYRIVQELLVTTPYRQVTVDWSPFATDGEPQPDMEMMVNREDLMAKLDDFLESAGLSAQFEGLDQAPVDAFINSLMMALPFEPAEKQALMEAQTVAARAELLSTIMTMAIYDDGSTELSN